MKKKWFDQKTFWYQSLGRSSSILKSFGLKMSYFFAHRSSRQLCWYTATVENVVHTEKFGCVLGARVTSRRVQYSYIAMQYSSVSGGSLACPQLNSLVQHRLLVRRPTGIIILHSLQMQVLLGNTTFLLNKIVRVAGIIRGRALYEEIRQATVLV